MVAGFDIIDWGVEAIDGYAVFLNRPRCIFRLLRIKSRTPKTPQIVRQGRILSLPCHLILRIGRRLFRERSSPGLKSLSVQLQILRRNAVLQHLVPTLRLKVEHAG